MSSYQVWQHKDSSIDKRGASGRVAPEMVFHRLQDLYLKNRFNLFTRACVD